jgi:cytosine/adenosine deaminase-related metal-dependent hydrolase
LGCGRLAIEALPLPFTVATDGLSSNDSLSILDELRAAIMLHNDIPIQELSQKLLRTVTADAADILGLNCGKIEIDKLADFAIITLPEEPKRMEELALWSILHTKEVSEVYIEGEKQDISL